MILQAGMDFVDRIASTLGDLLVQTGPAAPAILLAASFIEYVFPPFPGDAVVVLGAWYAVEGKVSWPIAFLAVTIGAVLGALADYGIGRWLAPRLDARASRRGALSAERLARFHQAYQRWGAALLLLNRFLPGVRGFIFVGAGAAGVPLGRVLFLGAVSAAVWNGLLLAAGRLLVKSLPELLELFREYSLAAWVVMGLITLAGAGFVLHRRRGRAPGQGEP
jgi:membrane protein DedA with SNARE-associated domain